MGEHVQFRDLLLRQPRRCLRNIWSVLAHVAPTLHNGAPQHENGKVFAPVRNNETLSLVRKIQVASQHNELVNLAKLFVSCANAITGKAVFDEVKDELQEQFLTAIDVGRKISGWFCFGDVFPSLWSVDIITGTRRRLCQGRWQLDAIFDKIIAQCASQRGDNLVSVLLRIRNKGVLDFPIDTTNINAIIGVIYIHKVL